MLGYDSVDIQDYNSTENIIPFQPWITSRENPNVNENWTGIKIPADYESALSPPVTTVTQHHGLASTDPISPPGSRERFTYTRYQLELMNSVFLKIRYPNASQKLLVAKRLGITKEQVKIWFQNRRRKDVTSSNGIIVDTKNKIVPIEIITSIVHELLAHASSSAARKPSSDNAKKLNLPSPADLDMQSPPNEIAPSSKLSYKRPRNQEHKCVVIENEQPTRKRRKSLEIADEFFPPNRICNSRLPIPGYVKAVEITSPANSIDYSYSPTPSSSSNSDHSIEHNFMAGEQVLHPNINYPRQFQLPFSFPHHDIYHNTMPTDVSQNYYNSLNNVFPLTEIQPYQNIPPASIFDGFNKNYINM